MPNEVGARAGNAPRRIAGNGGGPPEPLPQGMVGQVLQAGLHAPVVLARDEDEGVGGADLLCQLLQGRWCGARRMLLLHAVEHRQADGLGVHELNVLAAGSETGHEEISETMPMRSER